MKNNKLFASVKNEIDSKKEVPNRFELADVKRSSEIIKPDVHKKAESKSKLVKLYDNDSNIINNVRSTFMLNRKESTQTDIIRLGLLALSKLSEDELLNLYNEANLK